MTTTIPAGSGSRPSVLDRWTAPGIVVAGLAGVALLNLVRLRESFWIDELITRWVIDGDLATAWSRGAEFQSSGPTYFAMMWCWSQVAGTSEIALRVPSVLAMAGAAWFLVELGRELDRRLTGLIAALVFLANPIVFDYTANARPYPFELLLVVAAALYLVRWLRSGRAAHGVAWVTAAAVSIYFQPFAALALPALLVPIVEHRRTMGRELTWRLGPLLLLGAALLAPTVPYLLDVAGRSSLLNLGLDPTLDQLVPVLVPSAAAIAMLAGLIVAGRTRELDYLRGWPTRFALALALAPVVIIYGYSKLSATSIFVDRYLMIAFPGIGLLCGMLISRVGSARGRRVAVLVLSVLALFMTVPNLTDPTPWRQMIGWTNEQVDGRDAVFVFRPSLIEAADVRFVTEDEAASYLMVPIAAYPVDGPSFALPSDLDGAKGEYVDRLVADELVNHDVIAVFGPIRAWPAEYDFGERWAETLIAEGYELVDAPGFGWLRVDVFERR